MERLHPVLRILLAGLLISLGWAAAWGLAFDLSSDGLSALTIGWKRGWATELLLVAFLLGGTIMALALRLTRSNIPWGYTVGMILAWLAAALYFWQLGPPVIVAASRVGRTIDPYDTTNWALGIWVSALVLALLLRRIAPSLRLAHVLLIGAGWVAAWYLAGGVLSAFRPSGIAGTLGRLNAGLVMGTAGGVTFGSVGAFVMLG
ncbi:MAG: hypothetical protein GYB68_02795, partial [Chloroflexi bacterium]|nr:hypothetical protein [Chloroflexota bacterium]